MMGISVHGHMIVYHSHTCQAIFRYLVLEDCDDDLTIAKRFIHGM